MSMFCGGFVSEIEVGDFIEVEDFEVTKLVSLKNLFSNLYTLYNNSGDISI